MHLIPDFALLFVVWSARGWSPLKGFQAASEALRVVTLIVLIA